MLELCPCSRFFRLNENDTCFVVGGVRTNDLSAREDTPLTDTMAQWATVLLTLRQVVSSTPTNSEKSLFSVDMRKRNGVARAYCNSRESSKLHTAWRGATPKGSVLPLFSSTINRVRTYQAHLGFIANSAEHVCVPTVCLVSLAPEWYKTAGLLYMHSAWSNRL